MTDIRGLRRDEPQPVVTAARGHVQGQRQLPLVEPFLQAGVRLNAPGELWTTRLNLTDLTRLFDGPSLI